MAPTVVSIPTEQISQEIANFTIGFAKLIVRDNIEDAIGAGSGTLAVLGQVHGVLTAAHVLDSLPNTGPVGLVRYLNENGRYQKQTIDMAGATKLVIRAEEFGMNGPDLGFLRLPADSVGWLKAINSFYELRRYRDEYIAGKLPDGSPLMALVGMIDERTKDLPPERRGQRRKGFEALFTDGDIVSGRIRDRHELMDFVPKTIQTSSCPVALKAPVVEQYGNYFYKWSTVRLRWSPNAIGAFRFTKEGALERRRYSSVTGRTEFTKRCSIRSLILGLPK